MNGFEHLAEYEQQQLLSLRDEVLDWATPLVQNAIQGAIVAERTATVDISNKNFTTIPTELGTALAKHSGVTLPNISGSPTAGQVNALLAALRTARVIS